MSTPSPTIKISYDGVDYPSVCQFAQAIVRGAHKTGLKYKHWESYADTISRRLRNGWTVQRALMTPPKKGISPQRQLENNKWYIHKGLECSWWPTCRKIRGWT